MNIAGFFDSLRAGNMFAGSLSDRQSTGIQALLDQWGGFSNDASKRQFAYVLGTVYREAGRGMYPVREGFALSDQQAVGYVTDMFNRHDISHNYALPDPVTHKSYFGRGVVQITWADNYKRIGHLIGVDIYTNPDLALDPQTSAKIAVFGMQGGWFTGHKLQEYINSSGMNDMLNARKIINGTDHASLVAGYATGFLNAIIAAS